MTIECRDDVEKNVEYFSSDGRNHEKDNTCVIVTPADGRMHIRGEDGKASGIYTQIDQETAMEMMGRDDGHIVVDVRRQDEYDSSERTYGETFELEDDAPYTNKLVG